MGCVSDHPPKVKLTHLQFDTVKYASAVTAKNINKVLSTYPLQESLQDS